MNIKLVAFVALLAVGFYYFGTVSILPSIALLIAFIASPFSNQKNYVSSFAARSAKPNQTPPYRKYRDKLITHPKGISTLYENFQEGLKRSGPNAPCLGTREDGKPYEWETYGQVDRKIRFFGSGLLELGIEKGDRIGFYSKNRAEWFIGAESCNAYSLVSVAIYDTLGEENREYIIKQSKVRVIITTNNLIGYLNKLAHVCTDLRHVVVCGKVSEEERRHGKEAGLHIHSFEEVISLGENNYREPSPPHPDDLAILMYTSGTTSRPKGVMISNRNVIAVVAGVDDAIPKREKDCYLSYLPLAHILERAAEAYIISRGGKIGFFQGDLRKLTDDILQLKPTVYAGVPKVFQRIMNEVKKQINDKGPIVRALFKICYSLKRKFRQVGLPTVIFDILIFNKTKIGLGGKVSTIVSGGAPLPQECHEFLSICFGPTVQGYGLTETCGGATITPVDYITPWERAGSPISSVEIKLVSTGKYSTSTNPPQGELCVKGDNVAHGYYEMPEKTSADFVIEEDGERWFHTGDVARRNSDGTFSIVGRVKDIFKLDTGEYIAPERLESIYAQSKFISNIFVWGDPFKSFIVALVVPEYNAAARWASENGVKFPENAHPPNCPAELCRNENFKKEIVADLKRIATEAKLNRYEELPFIELDGLFWVPDTGLVTDALKNKRDSLYAHYQEQVNALYANNHV